MSILYVQRETVLWSLPWCTVGLGHMLKFSNHQFINQRLLINLCRCAFTLPSDILGLKCEKIISLKHYSRKFKVTPF